MLRSLSKRFSSRRLLDGLAKETDNDDNETVISMSPVPKGIEKCILRKNKEEELGKIDFLFTGETFNRAKEEAKLGERPIFILFQELPGSSECQQFGRNVLSHPLLVEAAESLFVTMVVNSLARAGGDADVMRKYHESHLNSPVIRIVNEKGRDLVVRLADEDCSIGGIAKAMINSLERSKSHVPEYLRILATEYISGKPRHLQRVREIVLEMASPTQAELDFADMNGALGCEIGTVASHKVIKVVYDSSVVSYGQLVRQGLIHAEVCGVFFANEQEQEEAQAELEHFGAWPSPIYDLRLLSKFRRHHSNKNNLLNCNLRNVPLTRLQAMRVNKALSLPRSELLAHLMLSPRQVSILEAVETKPPRRHVIDVEIEKAWDALQRYGVYDWR